MEDYERAAALIQENEADADFAGSRSPELIDLAEQAVGHQFPPTYRRFLREYGAGDIAGVEIYGLIDGDFENSGIPDAVWHNLTARREGHGEGLFAFYASGDGLEFCLDTSHVAPDGEMPVVGVYLWGEEREEIASDFGAAFVMLLEDALAE